MRYEHSFRWCESSSLITLIGLNSLFRVWTTDTGYYVNDAFSGSESVDGVGRDLICVIFSAQCIASINFSYSELVYFLLAILDAEHLLRFVECLDLCTYLAIYIFIL